MFFNFSFRFVPGQIIETVSFVNFKALTTIFFLFVVERFYKISIEMTLNFFYKNI